MPGYRYWPEGRQRRGCSRCSSSLGLQAIFGWHEGTCMHACRDMHLRILSYIRMHLGVGWCMMGPAFIHSCMQCMPGMPGRGTHLSPLSYVRVRVGRGLVHSVCMWQGVIQGKFRQSENARKGTQVLGRGLLWICMHPSRGARHLEGGTLRTLLLCISIIPQHPICLPKDAKLCDSRRP